MWDDRILKTGKNNNFRPKSIYDLLSYFGFKTDLFFVLSKITAISHSHNVKKEVNPKDSFPVVKELSSEKSHVMSEVDVWVSSDWIFLSNRLNIQ